MSETTGVPYGRKTQTEPAVKEIHVLWITAGLSCDGDSVSITAATQPSIEDIVLGAIPGLPKVHLHNPVLAYEVGDEFMNYWHQADEGRLGPVRAGRSRGRSPTRRSRTRATGPPSGPTRRPASRSPTCEWIDRLAPQGRRPSSPPAPAPPTAASTRWPATRPAHGPGRLPRLELAVEGRPADRQRAGLPGPAGQLHGDPALPALPGRRARPDDPARRGAAADLALRQDRARGVRPRGLLRAGRLRPRVRLAQVPGARSAAGGRWSTATSPSGAGWRASAAAPTSAASASAAPCPASPTSSCRSWTSRPAAMLSSTA